MRAVIVIVIVLLSCIAVQCKNIPDPEKDDKPMLGEGTGEDFVVNPVPYGYHTQDRSPYNGCPGDCAPKYKKTFLGRFKRTYCTKKIFYGLDPHSVPVPIGCEGLKECIASCSWWP